METDDLGGYIKELADQKGVSVVTVSDGWVMMFTKQKLQELIGAAENQDHVLVFIKNSDSIVKN